MDDQFALFDLQVSVEGDPASFVCSHKVGPAFKVIGENVVFEDNNKFSMYALSAMLPLLPVKQRETHKNDWITSDEYVSCPDPCCSAKFQIRRIGESTFHHAEATRVPPV